MLKDLFNKIFRAPEGRIGFLDLIIHPLFEGEFS
jgi:hypothetical protein